MGSAFGGGNGGGPSFGGGMPSFGGGGGLSMPGFGGMDPTTGAGLGGFTFGSLGGGIGDFLGGAGNPFKAPEWQKAGMPSAPVSITAPTDVPDNGYAQINTHGGFGGAADPFRQAQLQSINQLQGQATGQNSVANIQTQQAQANNLQQSLAMANSSRGGFNPALARAAMQQGAQANASIATQGMQNRLAEQIQASQAMGQIAGQGYGQDAQTAAINAGYRQQAKQQLSDLQAKYAGMGMDAQKANVQAMLDWQQMVQNTINQNNQTGLNAQAAQKKGIGDFLQGGASALAKAPELLAAL